MIGVTIEFRTDEVNSISLSGSQQEQIALASASSKFCRALYDRPHPKFPAFDLALAQTLQGGV